MARNGRQRQDLSGHIAMDVQLSNFYKEYAHRAHRTDKLREFGALEQRPYRNPLAAEKTPRKDFKGFEFKGPPAEPEPVRWQLPNSDWGLMSKFASQKPIYDDIFQKEKDHQKIVAEFNEIKRKNEEKIQKVLDEQKSKFDNKTGFQSATELHLGSPSNMVKVQQAAARIAAEERAREKLELTHASTPPAVGSYPDELDMASSAAQSRSQKSTKKKKPNPHFLSQKADLDIDQIQELKHLPKSLSEVHVSKIKSLQKTHPEVLEKWRADRAAEFVSRQRDPTRPPPRRSAAESAFKPAGSIDRHSMSKAKTLPPRRSDVLLAAAAAEKASALPDVDVHALLAELEKTEAEIAKQSLRVALKDKSAESMYSKGRSTKHLIG